ncbi:hypothetical protein [Mycobacterium sp. E2238]|uniref:hypothetical protein n=1 Tax=Mycobacterium sp. E2238 TaxID=1834131 RepID=UPI0009ED4539|nr:hypothetical protein [Mycobacterium sp. E2238]
MALGPRTASAKGRLLRAHRQPIDPLVLEAAQRGLAEAKIHDFIEKVLADAPPLTDEQRARLSELLRPVQIRPGA